MVIDAFYITISIIYDEKLICMRYYFWVKIGNECKMVELKGALGAASAGCGI